MSSRLIIVLAGLSALSCESRVHLGEWPDGAVLGRDGSPQPDATVSTWPTFTGDCQGRWNQPLTARNGSLSFNPNPVISFVLDDRAPGEPVGASILLIDFEAAAIGRPLKLDPTGGREVKVTLILRTSNSNYKSNTTYSQYGAAGQVHGTLTVKAYDPSAGTAEFVFADAALVGEDQMYAGTLRCGINGTLAIRQFARTMLGARCQTDFECGSAYSGRVCDNTTFVCVLGCHRNEDCPLTQTCNATAHTCG